MTASKLRREWIIAALSIFATWGAFLVLMGRIWPYRAILFGDEYPGVSAYAWIHQIPRMAQAPTIHLWGWTIPAMLTVYHGPWSIYFFAPFIAVGGCTLMVARCYSALMFLLALWGTWRLAFLISGRWATAFCSAFLLAILPASVMTRCVNLTAPDVAGAVWALCFAVSFARTRRQTDAYAACAALFAALGARSAVAGLAAGLMLYAVLMRHRLSSLLPSSRIARFRFITGCLACAGFFLLPALLYNAGHGWPTIRFYAVHLIRRSKVYPCSSGPSCANTSYWMNLKLRFSQLESLSDGDGVIMMEPWHWIYFVLLLFSFAHSALNSWKRRTLWNARALLWTAAIGYILASPISPTEIITLHLVPLAPILCVLAFSWIDAVPNGIVRKTALSAMVFVCAVQFAGSVRLLRRNNVYYDLIGWYGNSPLLVDASLWAAKHSRTPLISLSMPFSMAAPYFSQNQAQLMPWPAWNPSYPAPWKRWLLRKDRPYFLVENDTTGRQATAALLAHAAKLRVSLFLAKSFPDPRGRPAFEVYRAR